MATFEGLAVPIYGESQLYQTTAATDFITLTGSTATQTGDFFVCENSTGAEMFVVSASGAVSAVSGISAASGAFTAGITLGLSSSASDGIQLAVTSTGAIATGTAHGSALYVYASSKSVMNAVVAYVSSCTGGEVGTCQALLLTQGSKAPDYFVVTGATAAGVGAVGDNGFVEAGLFLTSALATTVPITALKCLLGSGTYYIPCYTTTTLAAS